MEDYALFAGSMFYPRGGWNDFRGYFDSVDNAKEWFDNYKGTMKNLWMHIVYIPDGAIVYEKTEVR
jgi:hypothetical protein